MTSEQWQHVKELFEQALECEPRQRAAFLSKASGGDHEVRQEVESLLIAHELDSEFMNEPVGNLIVDAKPILTTGQRFGYYDDISLVGEGGMGQVYVGVDTRLGRKVALKLLPSSYAHDKDRAQRLELEARAASALNHPNIVTIHEIGETDSVHFMATEFVDGLTLREHMKNAQMTVGEVLDITSQIASALQAAHEAGIVHRDIKPENIMVRRDGVVKVLDFGLAKPTPQAESDTPIRSLIQTHSGLIAGTVGYMSPEQTRGEELDARTDVWSLGVVLYELVAGHTPFRGETPRDVILSITKDELLPLASDAEIPSALARIVARALSKERTQRYQTAAEIGSDLKNLKEDLTLESRLKQFRGIDVTEGSAAFDTSHTRPRSTADFAKSKSTSRQRFVNRAKHYKLTVVAAALLVSVGLIGVGYGLMVRNRNAGIIDKKSIAILPLRPIDPSNRDEVYELAVAEALTHRIGSINGLVIRPLAARHDDDTALDPLTFGKRQRVDYVLAASYLLIPGRFRMTAQLLNVASGVVENTFQIEKDTADMFSMQDAIADEVGIELLKDFRTTSRRQTAQRGTANEDAYRLYLHGIYLANNRNLPDAKRALADLEEAVRRDPNYARAWAGLAYVHRTISNWGSISTHEAYQKSIAAITKALSLDPNLSEAHSALCENKYLYEWDFTGAEQACRRAIELDPGSAQGHEIFARYLMGRGRHDEAIAEIKLAIDIDPSSRFYQRNYGRALFYARRFAEASAQFERVISMDRAFAGTHAWLSSSLALEGREPEAFESYLKLLAQRKVDEERIQAFKKVFETSGWQGFLRERAKSVDGTNPTSFDSATSYAQVGDKDMAFQHLEEMYQRRDIWTTYLRVDPRFDSLRDDPRYVDLLRRMETNKVD